MDTKTQYFNHKEEGSRPRFTLLLSSWVQGLCDELIEKVKTERPVI